MARPVFGMPFGQCAIVSASDGVMPIEPMSYNISYSNHSCATAEVTGILIEQEWGNAASVVLSGVSMFELLAEVNRRIKTGENITKKDG